MRRTVRAHVAVLAIFALLSPINGFAADKDLPAKKDPEQIGDRNVGKGVNLYSIEKEISMGKRYAQDIERQAKLVEDPVITEYVNRLGQNLVRNSDVKIPVSIKVIDSDEVNAFALPGGFFYVNTGLVLRAETEAELAGVMAHEIGSTQIDKGKIKGMIAQPIGRCLGDFVIRAGVISRAFNHI